MQFGVFRFGGADTAFIILLLLLVGLSLNSLGGRCSTPIKTTATHDRVSSRTPWPVLSFLCQNPA